MASRRDPASDPGLGGGGGSLGLRGGDCLLRDSLGGVTRGQGGGLLLVTRSLLASIRGRGRGAVSHWLRLGRRRGLCSTCLNSLEELVRSPFSLHTEYLK